MHRSKDLVIPASIRLRTLEASKEELWEKLTIRGSAEGALIIQGPALREQSDANYLYTLVFCALSHATVGYCLTFALQTKRSVATHG